MQRTPRARNRPVAASKTVSGNAGHADPSCSERAYQSPFRPITRSMTRISTGAASSDVKEGQSASTSGCKTTLHTSLAIPSAAFRPTVTRARTPRKVTSSAWQSVIRNDQPKRVTLPTTTCPGKRSRIASSQAAKDSSNHSAARANSSDPSNGKRSVISASEGGQLDGTVVSLPPQKLRTHNGKRSSNALTKVNSTSTRKGGQLAAPVVSLPTKKSQNESGKNSSNVLTKVTSATANEVDQLAAAVVSLPAHNGKNSSNVLSKVISSSTKQVGRLAAPVVSLPVQKLQTNNLNNSFDDLAKATSTITSQGGRLPAAVISLPMQKMHTNNAKNSSNVLTKATSSSTSQVGQLAAPVVSLPTQKLQAEHGKDSSNVLTKATPTSTSKDGGSAAAAVPLPAPKLQIGNVKDSSNIFTADACISSLVKKQQEQLLLKHKLPNPPSQRHIKGPALSLSDDPPPLEPLGARCQLCRLDLAFRLPGHTDYNATGPPVVAVLPCCHTFHSSCLKDVYGPAEPSQCISCLDPGTAR